MGMGGWDLRLCHYFTPQVDSELLRLLDLVQLGLGIAFLIALALASFETTTISALSLEKESRASRWKTFIEVDEEEFISGLSALGVSAIPSRETIALIEKFVCRLSSWVVGPSTILLTYVNDLPNRLHSEVKLFADDALLDPVLANDANCDQRKEYLYKLEEWQHRWQMEFKPSKCKILCISTKQNPPKSKHT